MAKNEEQKFKDLLSQLDLDEVEETTWDPSVTKKRAHELIDLMIEKPLVDVEKWS